MTDNIPSEERVRTDTERLDFMERYLKRPGSVLVVEGQPSEPRNAWAVASKLATLRETIDALIENLQ